MVKKILVSCTSNPNNNPRPNRAINYFKKRGIDLWIISYPTQEKIVQNHFFISDYNSDNLLYSKAIKYFLSFVLKLFLPKSKIGLINSFRFNFSIVLPHIKGVNFDYILVEDLQLLPFIVDNFSYKKIVFDAREYFPLEFESSLLFRLFESKERHFICQNYLPKCHDVVTISQTFSDLFNENYKVKCKVVLSAPEYIEIKPSKVLSNQIRMVYHGAANKDRKLENLIKLVSALPDNYFLDLVLVGNSTYIKKLKVLINSNRIRILEKWPYKLIISNLNKYDIGICYFEPTTFNLLNALPNKFFEFIQARLAIVIGPSPSMLEFLTKYNLGISSREFDLGELGRKIAELTPNKIMEFKMNSDKAAKQINSSIQLKVFDEIFV